MLLTNEQQRDIENLLELCCEQECLCIIWQDGKGQFSTPHQKTFFDIERLLTTVGDIRETSSGLEVGSLDHTLLPPVYFHRDEDGDLTVLIRRDRGAFGYTAIGAFSQ